MKHKDYNEFAITLDIDWAPDIAIDAAAATLIKNEVKATWYVTHSSPAVDRLMQNKEWFECGIHPNFLPGSSHGSTYDEVLDHVSGLVPGATSVRAHALVQSSHIVTLFREKYGMETETSLFLRETPDLKPHVMRFRENGDPLLRIPYFWEDDTETINPEKSWEIASPKYHQKGLKIMNFHPMYIYLNCDTMEGYETVKKAKPLFHLTQEDMAGYIHPGKGTGSFFEELTSYMGTQQHKSFTMKELAADWYSIQ